MGAFLQDILPPLVLLVIAAWTCIWHTYGYWKRRGVPYLEPIFPFGNGDSLISKGFFVGNITKKFYDQFKAKGHPVGGIYIGMKPMLVMVSPESIKEVLVSDFQDFTDRGIYVNEKDPLSIHLATQAFAQWKPARAKFTPLFTSVKIKAMFKTILDCSEGLKDALEYMEAQQSDVDALEVAACYTTDVIGSCGFGIDCNSFKNPDAGFRAAGRKYINEFSVVDKINILLTICAPGLAKKLGARNVQKDVSRFFLRTIRDTVEYREKNDVRRNDLLQLLIDMKNSEEGKLTMNELIGQVFMFFLAGFETSSSTIAMTLFEISRNQDVQGRIREEILEVLKKYDGRITYDALAEMKYLGQAIDETLRIWPPSFNLNRMCTKDHKFQNSDVTVEKGTPILIPTWSLHHDPEYWPDPEKWDPDRFSEENKDKIRPFAYFPFGDGPRNCLGIRLGILQTKIPLVTVLRNYRVSLSPKTVTPLRLDPQHFFLHILNKVYLRLEKI